MPGKDSTLIPNVTQINNTNVKSNSTNSNNLCCGKKDSTIIVPNVAQINNTNVKLNSTNSNNLCYGKKDKRVFQKYDDILDSEKYGEKYLSNDKIAGVVKHCLHYPDNKDYNLICYSIMSNHVHIMFKLIKGNKGLSKIMQSIKRISATRSNKILGRTGTFWQDESFDRLIRNEKEFLAVLRYVLNNPVKAGLVAHWQDWKNSYCHTDYLTTVGQII
ncbi:MAG: transposase [Ignavibacteria bacterium]|nr:transposase [Ignavibacteria bacterium]